VVSSDRGLCGAYNSNVLRELERWLNDEGPDGGAGRDVVFYVYGRKAYQYLMRRGREVERYFCEPSLERIDYRGAVLVTNALVEAFLSGEYRDVCVLYTAFQSMVRFVPTWVPFLPIAAESLGGEGPEARGDVILEPDAKTIFDELVPRYLETRVYNGLLEALTSEFASRRMSMKNATEAATDMQGALKGIYNRKRQESITKELLDIVGGVEALR
jgi:F-type H+-transporting ATPase subunit gamma